ncbi:hypothetical protein SAMN04489798_2358 [Pseudomonas arsenicoxydans]|uniref:Uncharacterized protein n=1 Tax=Pseudomonas arsenicoxydans TaxID=702115 RepID=A0A1H0HS11_9PSED|nr:hypothetical protein SAMN04489798_2358 [Pseudomonas arsenicoxydans]
MLILSGLKRPASTTARSRVGATKYNADDIHKAFDQAALPSHLIGLIWQGLLLVSSR